jgi:hypothetical protein
MKVGTRREEKPTRPLHLTKFQDRLSDAEFGKNLANLSNQFARWNQSLRHSPNSNRLLETIPLPKCRMIRHNSRHDSAFIWRLRGKRPD